MRHAGGIIVAQVIWCAAHEILRSEHAGERLITRVFAVGNAITVLRDIFRMFGFLNTIPPPATVQYNVYDWRRRTATRCK